MSKSIRSYEKSEREKVAKRRVYSGNRGIGYWAAVDYFKAIEKGKTDEQKRPQGN